MDGRDAARVPGHRQGMTARVWHVFAALAALLLLLAGATTPAHAASANLPRGCGASAPAGHFDLATLNVTGAHIALNTTSAASGSQIVVRGTGWPAGTQIIIGIAHFVQTDGVVNVFDDIAQAQVTSAGTFTAPTFALPTGTCGILPRAGSVAEIVAHTPDGRTQVAVPLSIVQTPAIAVDLPAYNLSRGATSIPVRGSAWVPGTAIRLTAATMASGCAPRTTFDYASCLTPLPGAQSVVALAGADGRFSISVPIPSTVAPGTDVQVRGAVSAPPYGQLVLQSEWHALMLPGVAPTLRLDHAAGPAGATLDVSGDHWPSGETVLVEYCRSDAATQSILGRQCNTGSQGTVTTGHAQALGEANVDESGHLSIRVTLPTNARSGAVLLQARLKSTAPDRDVYLQTAPFTITQTPLPQPAPPMWPFAVAGVTLLSLTGLLFWRRGALRLHFARTTR